MTIPSPLTAAQALTAWRADPVMLVFAVAVGMAYLAAVRRVRREGGSWRRRRTVAFLAGLVVLLLATCSWIGVYAPVLLWVFTTQVLILLLIPPVLLAMGRPFELVPTVLGREVTGSQLLRRLDNPLIGPALLPLLTALLFFTPLLDAALGHAAVGSAVRVTLLFAGLVLAVPLVGGGVSRPSLAIAAAIFVGFLELLADAVPGIMLRLAPAPLSSVLTAQHRPWGPSPLIDQHLAGSTLWVVAEVVDLPFLAVLVLQWIRADAREAAAVDARLDAIEATSPPAGDSASPDSAAPDSAAPDRPAAEQPDRVRPWWETDGRVFGTDRAARYRS
ncbi:MAG TPA: cytochrome c oxidase assembly protein [Frankiaceae bacterium]|nr:cytochrome c oxidase assembly protein [Frankiaceae bacterium]